MGKPDHAPPRLFLSVPPPQALTSYNNPQGNADTERSLRTLQEECLWLQEWTSSLALIRALDRWIEMYNHHYHHSG